MCEVSQAWDNAFTEPEISPGKKEKIVDKYRRRYQLLSCDDVMKLSDVMETTVPIDGKGNFPSLEVTPSTLVQLVRDGLSKEGIRVPNVRLNGSAATHVLSDDGNHPYKDLDLIFAVDLSEYNDSCTCGFPSPDFNENANNNNSYCRNKNTDKKFATCGTNTNLKPQGSETSSSHSNQLDKDINIDRTLGDDSRELKSPDSSSGILMKDIAGEDEEVDLEDKESGYTSSGSSVASLPISSTSPWTYQNPVRSRTHSLDSSSSVTSSSSVQQSVRSKDGHHHVNAKTSNSAYQRKSCSDQHELSARGKDSCWQKIKSVVLTILRELLPAGVKTSHMTDAIVTDAYVQKMVKISNEADRWSLISLHNNSGRNLELKFVENMRRQYEFSVDSFQIILDSYQRFKIVSRNLENDKHITLSPNFFPSVLAESVYGDFEAALRHLRHRRICTRRPEEIRGGGLLRYCNLRVRDFTPGEVAGYDVDCEPIVQSSDDSETKEQLPVTSLAGSVSSPGNVQSYSTSKPEAVRKLEQLMCSRFFIDFCEFDRQQRKLQCYLNGHFNNEEDLKFQYLLIVQKVVERGTVCLMSNERTQIVDYIKKLALETLSKNVKNGRENYPEAQKPTLVSHPVVTDTPNQAPPYPAAPSNSYHRPQIPYQYPQSSVCAYPQQQQPCNQNSAPCSHSYYPSTQFPQTNYAPNYYYPVQQPQPTYYPPQPAVDPNYYSACEGYYSQPQNVPIAMCPCCKSTYAQKCGPNFFHAENANPSPPQVVVTPPQHTMSPNSPPFVPSFKTDLMKNSVTTPTIYLGENDTLIYTPGPWPGTPGKETSCSGASPSTNRDTSS